MSYRVFISYRRRDQPAAALAELLCNRLVSELGGSEVFLDREELEEGDDFPQRIQEAVESALVFVALIGSQWNPVDLEGRRRLDNPRDFVRKEIARSLECKEADDRRHIIPVLVDGALFPTEELPNCLLSFSKYNGFPLQSPYEDGLLKVVQSIVRRLDAFDPTPPEEKWILQQISNILPSDKHRIRQIGRELKAHFDTIPVTPESARSLARALYLVGPPALQYLSPLGSLDTGINSLLKLLATHWIKSETARDLHDVFVNATDGKMATIECEYSEFTPEESLLKASHDIYGWPTVAVNPPDETEEIIQQVHEKLCQMFNLNISPRRTSIASTPPLSEDGQRKKICELLREHQATKGQPLPLVLHLEHLMALDPNLIRQLRNAFPPLHILVATSDPDGLKLVGRFIPIANPAETEEAEEKAYRAYGEASRRLRTRGKNTL